MLDMIRSTSFKRIRARIDRCLACFRILHFRRAIPVIFIALLVSTGCGPSDSESLYSDTLEAVESLQLAAEDFEFEIYGEWPLRINNYVHVKSENGQGYFWDWRPTWRDQSRPVEQQLSYAESTGKMTWAQLVDLQKRLDKVETKIESRSTAYQKGTFQRLKTHHEGVLQWIETAEFDISLKYLGLVNGARDRLMESRFGRESGVIGPLRSWSWRIVDDIFFYTGDDVAQLSRKLTREVEWALWMRFASQKGLDVTLLSSYVNECENLYTDSFKGLVRSCFGNRIPAEEFARIKDDITYSSSRSARSTQQTAKKRPSLAPNFKIKAFISAEDGAKALISPRKFSLNPSDYQLVQKGDLISLSGVEWIIKDINAVNKQVEVKSEITGMVHVIIYDH